MEFDFKKYASIREDANRLASKANSLASNIVICSHALNNKFTIISNQDNNLDVFDINIGYNKGNFLRLAIKKDEYETGSLNKLIRINSILSGIDEIKDYEYNSIIYEAKSNGENIIVVQNQLTKKKKA